jgi:hypothetical protein
VAHAWRVGNFKVRVRNQIFRGYVHVWAYEMEMPAWVKERDEERLEAIRVP